MVHTSLALIVFRRNCESGQLCAVVPTGTVCAGGGPLVECRLETPALERPPQVGFSPESFVFSPGLLNSDRFSFSLLMSVSFTRILEVPVTLILFHSFFPS